MSAITVNVKPQDKEAFVNICEKMGMNVSTAINVFIKAVNRTKRIPFAVVAEENSVVVEDAAN